MTLVISSWLGICAIWAGLLIAQFRAKRRGVFLKAQPVDSRKIIEQDKPLPTVCVVIPARNEPSACSFSRSPTTIGVRTAIRPSGINSACAAFVLISTALAEYSVHKGDSVERCRRYALGCTLYELRGKVSVANVQQTVDEVVR